MASLTGARARFDRFREVFPERWDALPGSMRARAVAIPLLILMACIGAPFHPYVVWGLVGLAMIGLLALFWWAGPYSRGRDERVSQSRD